MGTVYLGRDDEEVSWDKGRETWEYTPEDGLPRIVLVSLTVSVGTPDERDDGEPDGDRVSRFRRQEVYRIVALPPGMNEDTSKLAALEPRIPRYSGNARSNASTASICRPSTTPLNQMVTSTASPICSDPGRGCSHHRRLINTTA